MAAQPGTPAHYCPACRTTTPATTAEGLVQAGIEHRAECTGPAAGQPNCPCAPDCPDHGPDDVETAFMDCHCAGADEINRDATAFTAAVTAPTTT